MAEETSCDKSPMFCRICEQNKIQHPKVTNTIVTSSLNVHHFDTNHHRNFKIIEAGRPAVG